MKKTFIAMSVLAVAITGCSSKSAEPAPAKAAQATEATPTQSTPDNTEISQAGHSVLMQFYSFYALKNDQGFDEWLKTEFMNPDQHKDTFKKLFNPGTYTNVAVEFSGFKTKPLDKNQWNVSSDIKLHLINKPNNKEDIFNKHISVIIQKDEKTQAYKVVSFEDSNK
jgi:hypothetical protein